jgi:hypothetical protein
LKILFDQGTPLPLRRSLAGHTVDIPSRKGWSTLRNGALLDAAEQEGYEVLITTDQNIRHQQNLSRRTISIVVLMKATWPRIRNHREDIVEAVNTVAPGQVVEVNIR